MEGRIKERLNTMVDIELTVTEFSSLYSDLYEMSCEEVSLELFEEMLRMHQEAGEKLALAKQQLETQN